MLRLIVEGMSCGGCARSVTAAVKSIDPHADVHVDLATKRVDADTAADPETVSRAIAEAGYVVTPA